uniref:restriction endonuclease subunit S n=1 Tax=Algoriphagus sp. TaxID=1872435 RepID=UPI00258F245D
MNKQIVRRFQEFAQANGIELDLEKVDFELVNLVDDNLGRITFNPGKDRSRVKDLIDRKEKVSKVPMDSVDESVGMLKPILEEESIENLDAASYKYFEEGDVLWAKVTPCMENGNCAIAKNLKNGIGYGSTEFHVFRAKKGEIDSKYLWYFLRNKDFREQAKPTMTGSGGLKRVPKSFLENQFLPIPIASQGLSSFQIQQILVRFIEHSQSTHQRRLDGCAIIRPILDKMERSVVPRTLEKSRGARKLIKEFLKEKGIELDYEKVEFEEKKVSDIAEFPSVTRVLGGVDLKLDDYYKLEPTEREKYVPLVSGTVENNQISGFIRRDRISENNLSPEPCLSWTRINGSIFFRQEKSVCINDDSFVLIQKKGISDLNYLKILITIEASKSGFGWGNKAGVSKIKDLKILVPIDLNELSSIEIQGILTQFFDQDLARVN